MKERIRYSKPNDEGYDVIEKTDSMLEELLELTQSEPDVIERAVQDLKKEFERAPTIGATVSVDGLYNRARREFVVPLVSAEQKSRLLDSFTNLGIYPWEDNATLIIDHRKDLEKLRLAGFIATHIEPQPPFVPSIPASIEAQAPHASDFAVEPVESVKPASVDEQIQQVLEKLSKRVRPDAHAFPYPATVGKREPVRIARGHDSPSARELRNGEPLEIDEEIRSIVNAFNAGDPDVIDSDAFKTRFGDLPTLSLFPQKQVYVNGEMYDKHSGRLISKAERAETLALARGGDARALEESVRSNIGLALKSYARVWEKQGGSDLQPDDVFQEALIGLTKAIREHDPSRGALSTYAFVAMEHHMRRFIVEKRRPIHLPAHTSTIRSRYNKLKTPLEQAGPLKREALAAALFDQEMIHSPTEAALERFERTYFINTTFSPVDDAFRERIDLDAQSPFSHTAHEAVEDTERDAYIQEVLSKIEGSEELIIRLRFGIEADSKLDIRRLLNSAFNFSLPEKTLEEEPTEDLLKRARSSVEDRLSRRAQVGRPLRFVEMLEKAHELRNRELTAEDLTGTTTIERLFLTAYGNQLTSEQKEAYPVAHDSTLDEVGDFYGATRERVRQIEAKGLRHLKHPQYSKKLASMLSDSRR